MGAEIIKVMWDWAPERITALVRACIQLGHHPESWKVAKGEVISKPGKPDCKLVERTAAHLIADHLARTTQQAPRRAVRMPEKEVGCRCGGGTMNRTQQAWQEKMVAGALLMDAKAVFNNVSRLVLGRRLGELGIEADLIRWTDSFMSDRKVKLVLEGREGEEYEVETGSRKGHRSRQSSSRRICQEYLTTWRTSARGCRGYPSSTMWRGGRMGRRRRRQRRHWGRRRKRHWSGLEETG